MKYVMVDHSFLSYRAYYSMGNLAKDDIPTGVMFGYFSQLWTICHDPIIRSNRVLIFTDSRTSIRKKEYPEYKANRSPHKKTTEEQETSSAIRNQMDLLSEEILPRIGFPVYKQEGIESDDLMAKVAGAFTEAGTQAVMITADQDMFQCISPTVSWYDPLRRILFTAGNFRETHGIAAWKWGMVKSIAGCKTDNVKGILRVGERGAIDFLNGSLPAKGKKYQSIVSPEGKKTVEINTPLVCLPHPKTKAVTVREPKYRVKEFFQLCEQMGFQTFLKEASGWRGFFTGVKFQKARMRG